jgi:hypothetical protein
MNPEGQLTHAPFEASNHEFAGQDKHYLLLASQKLGAIHAIHLFRELM